MKDTEKNNLNWFSRQTKIVKVVVVLLGICIIGLIALSAVGLMLPDSMIPGKFNESKIYENEYISFKYPKSLLDISFFGPEEKGNVFSSIFADTEIERNSMGLFAKKLDPSESPTYLDNFYNDYNPSERNGLKNFTLEKININGIPAIKLTEEYYSNENGKHLIYVFLVHNDMYYTFLFLSDNLKNSEYMYKLFESSLVLKQ